MRHEIPILAPVFIIIHQKIIESAERYFEENPSNDNADPLKNKRVTDLYGFLDSESRDGDVSVAAAIEAILFSKFSSAVSYKAYYGLRGKNFSPRQLYDDIRNAEKLKDKPNDTINIRENYLRIYLDFIFLANDPDYPLLIGKQKPATLENLIKRLFAITSIDENLLEPQISLIEADEQNLLHTSREDENLKIPCKKIHCICHYVSMAYDEQYPGHVHKAILESFPGIIEQDGKKIIATFPKSPSNARYEGEVTFAPDDKSRSYAVLLCHGNRSEEEKRPLVIVLYNKSKRHWVNMDISLGRFINIDRDSNIISRPILLEKIDQEGGESVFFDHSAQEKLLKYLSELTNDNFINDNIFDLSSLEEAMVKRLPNWDARRGLEKLLQNTYFECFLLSKKREATIESTLFHFTKHNMVVCKVKYTGEFIYYGSFTINSHNKAIIQFSDDKGATYQLAAKISLEHDQIEYFHALYSGINQDGDLAGGRCMFFQISREAFQAKQPEHFPFSDQKKLTPIINQHPGLIDFLAGELDKELKIRMDEPRFLKNPVFGRFQNHDKLTSGLGVIPGTYYYYRTRTIPGRSHEIKRYPFLIDQLGNIRIKFVSDKQELESIGAAFRLKNCLYVDMFKIDQGRYDGLAIFYPESWTKTTIQPLSGLYISTSKNDDPMSGRAFLRRVNNIEFEDMKFCHLNSDEINASDETDIFEQRILEILKGESDNYFALRNSNFPQRPYSQGEMLFFAAVGFVITENLEKGAQCLYDAIIKGRVTDKNLLKDALSQDGMLYPIKGHVSKWKETIIPYLSRNERDVRSFLEALLPEILQ